MENPLHPADIVRDIAAKEIKGAKFPFITMPMRESARPNVTPEGPLGMATNLIQNYGIEVSIIDLNAYRINDELAQKRRDNGEDLPYGRHKTFREAEILILKHFSAHGEPDLVAFSGKITTFRWQQAMAKIIRKILPNIFLVTGGGLATELGACLFDYIPEIDGVARSEGDDVIIKIVYDALIIKRMGFKKALNANKLNPYYIGSNGRHRFVYAGDRPRDLNKLPYADLELLREDVDGNPVLEWYLQTPVWSRQANNSSAIPWEDEDVIPKTTSVSSRGCPYGCKYCFRGSQGERLWGVRSAAHIMRELEERISRYGIKFHGFPDDNFAVNLDRIKQLNNLVSWGTHTRLDELAGLIKTTKDTAKIMAKAGCRYVGAGPETGSKPIIEVLGKGGHTLTNGMMEVKVDGRTHSFPRSMIIGVMKALEYGIHLNCTWIVGSPTEKLKNLQETSLFMLWEHELYASHGLPIDSVNTRMFTLTWYPGTTIINYDRVRQELTRVFGISFQPAAPNTSGVKWDPVYDDSFLTYMLELDDATKVLHGKHDEPLNFSDMPTDVFLQAREHIDNGNTLKILDMN